jgi:microcystin-dependent protein
MSDDPFVGEIQWVSFNFAPKNWALCNGQLLPINQNQALFSLLGTMYGGDGRTTFALPDLRGRIAISQDNGTHQVGEVGGAEAVTLNQTQLPAHTHGRPVTDHRGTSSDPGSSTGPVLASGPRAYAAPSSGNAVFAPTAVGAVGGNQPHLNLQPYLTLTAIICLQGIFPSRN